MPSSAFWRDKVVLITGASSGIGAALATLLAQRGSKVGLIGRSHPRLAEVHARIGPGSAFAIADVADIHALAPAVQQLEARLGCCDVMIANAGIHRRTNGAKLDTAVALDAHAVITTNVCGVVNAFACVAPGMVQRRQGRLCAIASIAGLLGLPRAAVYSASKAAVLTLCDGFRVDLEPMGIRVTAVGPGFVETPMLHPDDRQTPDGLRVMSADEAARRIVRAIERGRARCFFPTGTWLKAWLVSRLPASWYVRLWGALIRKKQRMQASGEW